MQCSRTRSARPADSAFAGRAQHAECPVGGSSVSGCPKPNGKYRAMLQLGDITGSCVSQSASLGGQAITERARGHAARPAALLGAAQAGQGPNHGGFAGRSSAHARAGQARIKQRLSSQTLNASSRPSLAAPGLPASQNDTSRNSRARGSQAAHYAGNTGRGRHTIGRTQHAHRVPENTRGTNAAICTRAGAGLARRAPCPLLRAARTRALRTIAGGRAALAARGARHTATLPLLNLAARGAVPAPCSTTRLWGSGGAQP